MTVRSMAREGLLSSAFSYSYQASCMFTVASEGCVIQRLSVSLLSYSLFGFRRWKGYNRWYQGQVSRWKEDDNELLSAILGDINIS